MRPTFLVIAAALAVGIAYATLASGSGFLYDDRQLILDEIAPQGLADLAPAWTTPYYGVLPYYRPLTRLTYMIQKGLSGATPLPFHLFNAVLAAALLVGSYALLRCARFRIARLPALAAATLFVLHPVASSCILPIAGRDTLLPLLLMIGATTCWVRPGRLARVCALTLFAAALLSKEVAIATPLVFLLADATAAERPPNAAAWLVRHAPWIAIVASYLTLRHAVLAGLTTPLVWSAEPLLPLATVGYGLQSAFVPFVSLLYEPALTTWLSWPRLTLAVIATALLFVAARRRSVPHGAANALFWLGWFVAVQLPAANFVHQETRFDERYAYPALLGLLALAATAWPIARAAVVRRAGVALFAAALCACVAVTVHRAAVFADEWAFHQEWVRTSPESVDAQNGLGVALLDRDRPAEAERAFRAALGANPNHPEAQNNLAVLLLDRGQIEPAVALLESAVASSPGYAVARYNLANARAREGRLGEAEALYRAAIALRPGYVSAWNNLGTVLARAGRADDAIDALEEVARLDPAHAKARLNKGILLARQGRLAQAIVLYREAIALSPDDPDAHFNLGAAALASGDRGTAERELTEALRLKPGWAEARALIERVRAAPD